MSYCTRTLPRTTLCHEPSFLQYSHFHFLLAASAYAHHSYASKPTAYRHQIGSHILAATQFSNKLIASNKVAICELPAAASCSQTSCAKYSLFTSFLPFPSFSLPFLPFFLLSPFVFAIVGLIITTIAAFFHFFVFRYSPSFPKPEKPVLSASQCSYTVYYRSPLPNTPSRYPQSRTLRVSCHVAHHDPVQEMRLTSCPLLYRLRPSILVQYPHDDGIVSFPRLALATAPLQTNDVRRLQIIDFAWHTRTFSICQSGLAFLLRTDWDSLRILIVLLTLCLVGSCGL